ncbi:MAG: ribonuclease P protein component, partial [Lancefieldella rimae]
MKTIKSPREFERVFSCGKRAYGSLICIRVAKTCEDGEARVAFVAPKRLGNAVVRNRCKRVLREAARIESLPVEGYGII